jgi:hypothetical protein
LPQEVQSEAVVRKDIGSAIYRRSQPNDAAALVELTHKTYAYTFAEPEFYYSERLAEAIKNESIASVVAEHNGAVVAHIGLAYHSAYPNCAEVGMLMINPEYRQTRLSFILSKKFIELIFDKSRFRRNIFTSVATTAHKTSQHMIIKLGSIYPIMIMISACPRADYENSLQKNRPEREALVFGIKLNYESECTVYLSSEHHLIMSVLLDQLNANVNLLDQEAESYAAETRISLERFDLSFSANIILERYSDNWVEVLRNNLYVLRNKGIRTVNIMVPAWKVLPPDIRANMKTLNAFFTGMPVFEKDKWYVAYTSLDSEILKFDEIEIYNPATQDLLGHIKDEYEYVLGAAATKSDEQC